MNEGKIRVIVQTQVGTNQYRYGKDFDIEELRSLGPSGRTYFEDSVTGMANEALAATGEEPL